MGFDTIYGQEKVITYLQKNLKQGLIQSSYIFEGPNSVGKKLTALTFAKALNCSGEKLICDECDACLRINKGLFYELRLIKPEEAGKQIKINTIRDVINFVSLRVMAGKYKVIIFEDADHLNEEASNALLKTLEEPKGDTVFIFITTNASKLLPTIISRSVKLRFFPLTDDVMIEVLKEKYNIPEERGKILARLSSGSIEKALYYDDEKVLSYRKFVVNELIKIVKGDKIAAFELAEELAKNKEEIENVLKLFKSWLYDIAKQIICGYNHNLVNEDLKSETELSISENLFKEPYRFYKEIEITIGQISRNANKKLALESLFLNLRG